MSAEMDKHLITCEDDDCEGCSDTDGAGAPMSAEMDVKGLAQWLSDYNAFRGGLLAGPFDTFEPVGPLKLENRLRQAAALFRSQAEEIERLIEERNEARSERDALARQLQEAVEERDRLLSALSGLNPEHIQQAVRNITAELRVTDAAQPDACLSMTYTDYRVLLFKIKQYGQAILAALTERSKS